MCKVCIYMHCTSKCTARLSLGGICLLFQVKFFWLEHDRQTHHASAFVLQLFLQSVPYHGSKYWCLRTLEIFQSFALQCQGLLCYAMQFRLLLGSDAGYQPPDVRILLCVSAGCDGALQARVPPARWCTIPWFTFARMFGMQGTELCEQLKEWLLHQSLQSFSPDHFQCIFFWWRFWFFVFNSNSEQS